MPTREDYEHAIGRAQRAGDDAAVQDLIQRAASEVTGPAGIMANIGAGTDTFIQGAKQLVGMGMDDEQLREKRRIDQMAAASTPGGGVAQFVGEALPTLALPGGTGARVLTKTMGALGRAPTALAAGRTSLPLAMGGGALENAAMSAFTPTTADESKFANIGIGGGFGAGVPLLGKALAATGRAAYGVGERALAAVPGGIGERAAQRVGARGAEESLRGANVPMDPARYRAQDYQPNTRAPNEFSPSTAAAYHGTPELAAVEKATRQFDAPSWATRDAGEAGKRWEHLDTSLRGEGDVNRITSRLDTMDPPYGAVGPKLWETNMAGFVRDLENMTASPAYIGNPTVRGAVDMLRKQIDSGTIVPETLHELRKTLTKGLAGPPGASDAAVRASKNDPHILKLVERIDGVMENSIPASKRGAWGDWRSNYSGTLAEAEGAKAENQLRRRFVDEHGRPLSGGGTVPEITPTKLTRAADDLSTVGSGPRTGQPQFTPQARQAVSDILENLNAQGIVQAVTKAATLGGSATAHNFAMMGMTGVLGDLMFDHLAGSSAGLIAGGLVGARSRASTEAAKRAILSRIMQDPAQFRAFIAQSAQRAQQLASQQGVAAQGRGGRSLAVTGAQLATEPQQQQ